MKTPLVTALAVACSVILPAFATAQTCVEPPDGLISWWPADGTAEDVIGTNDGTLAGNTSFGPGVVGTAFVLDGSGDWIFAGDDPSLQTQQLSIEGWVRTTALDDLFVAANSGSTGFFGYELATDDSGVMRFLLNGGADGADVFGTSAINDGEFHHVAAAYDGRSLSLYVDGALQAQVAAPTMIDYETGAGLLIGAREYGPIPGFWSGAIDELSVYSRGLCRNEVEAIYAAGSAGKCFGGAPVDCSIFRDGFESGGLGAWSAP